MNNINLSIKEKIRKLADDYNQKLIKKVNTRIKEMDADDKSHYLIYNVLGIKNNEGYLIDIYQNKGRFLYKYAGSFLENATILCFQEKYANAKKHMIHNNLSKKPKNFEIDCLIDNKAYEIKWRDSTTDGDHIIKEHTRIKAIKNKGYIPIRIMFYYPNRINAIKIQQILEALYHSIGGEYYYGLDAWEYIEKSTGINLLQILKQIIKDRSNCEQTSTHK